MKYFQCGKHFYLVLNELFLEEKQFQRVPKLLNENKKIKYFNNNLGLN